MGPLTGLKVVEFCGIGPGPMCAMLLADLGATVIRIDRREPSDLGIARDSRFKLPNRGRKSIALDLKSSEHLGLALELVDRADALIEGFRPGVAERLGFGPEVCMRRNPKLVYGRMTGWGQTGPLSKSAGHDLNYIAITGALAAIGRYDLPPTPPLNLVGDYGGGSLYLAMGILAALWECKTSGQGQVVDASVVEGTLSLLTTMMGSYAAGEIKLERGTNILDSGAPFYDTYQCADDKWIAVGAIEAKFYDQMIDILGLKKDELPPQMQRESWPKLREIFSKTFLTKTRNEWCSLLEARDTCFAPVLSIEEAREHPQIRERNSLINIDGIWQPAPAPRFSRTPPAVPSPPEHAGASSQLALEEWGFSRERIDQLRQVGVLDQAKD